MKLYLLTALILGGALVGGCENQGNERLKEKAQIEGRETAEEETKAQNENLAQKSSEMEEDLKVRHRFYQAVKGNYEGTFKTEQGTFKIKLNLVPSLPPYTSDRVRQLDEIVADINNLYLNAQIVQWNPSNSLSAVGCRIENIRPDIVNGTIDIASENCANFYGLWVAQADDAVNIRKPKPTTLDPRVSGEVATSIRDGRYNTVAEIQGEVHPTTNAIVYEFSAVRKVK